MCAKGLDGTVVAQSVATQPSTKDQIVKPNEESEKFPQNDIFSQKKKNFSKKITRENLELLNE